MPARPPEEVRTVVGLRVAISRRGKKGIYHACYHEGGHRRESLKTTNKKVAIEKALLIEHRLATGEPQATRQESRVIPTKVADAVAAYLAYLTTERLAAKTLTKYLGILGTFATFLADHRKATLDQVALRDVDPFRAGRRPLLSDKSMYREASLLKRWPTWCRKRKLVAADPLADSAFSRPPGEPSGGPTLDEINRILAKAHPVRYPILATLAFTGMRVGECRNLRPEDIDLDAGRIRIVSREGAETKTRKSRDVPIHPRLAAILREVRAGKTWFFTALPSPRYPGGQHHINERHVLEDFRKTLGELGLPVGREGGFVIHSLGHSFKTIAINAGVPQHAVDIWQGHAPDLRSASRQYYDLTEEESRKHILKLPFGIVRPTASRKDNPMTDPSAVLAACLVTAAIAPYPSRAALSPEFGDRDKTGTTAPAATGAKTQVLTGWRLAANQLLQAEGTGYRAVTPGPNRGDWRTTRSAVSVPASRSGNADANSGESTVSDRSVGRARSSTTRSSVR